MSVDKANLTCVKIDSMTTPKSGVFRIICNAWWVVTPEGEIMFYRGASAQCNDNIAVTTRIRDKIYEECSVQQIPVVYVPLKPGDYDV